MAFEYFKQNSIDIAVIEVGMGGRLDSTNIISPEISVITNISFDHTQFLGDTIEEIAKEKAGIIKNNIPVIIGENKNNVSEIFKTIAKEKKSEISFSDEMTQKEYECDLKGSYQKNNIRTSINAINSLVKSGYNINEKNIIDGLKNVIRNTGIKGRWEILGNDPLIICDAAHNKDALSIVINDLKSTKCRIHFVLGFVNDKSVDSIIGRFPESAKFYFTRPDIERGLDELELKKLFNSKNRIGESFKNVKEALKSAIKKSNKNDLIFVGGSTFVVAEVV